MTVHIVRRRSPPIAAVLLGLLATAVFGWGLAHSSGVLCWAALLPGLLTLAAAASRAPAFGLTLTDTGVQIDGRSEEIPYAHMSALQREPGWLPARAAAPLPFKRIRLYHAEGQIELDRALDRPLQEIYTRLLERLPICGARELHREVVEFHAAALVTGGGEAVRTFAARGERAPGASIGGGAAGRRFVSFGFALVTAGLTWIIVSMLGHGAGLLIFCGVTAILVGFVVLAMGQGVAPPPRAALADASLVLAPRGFAFKIAEEYGERDWTQVRRLRRRTSYRSGLLGGEIAAFTIETDGARIVIPDCFDRPLDVIYELVERAWRAATRAGTEPLPPGAG